MSTVPSTLVIFSEDKVNFPIKYALVVMKQLFQYGVKEMSVKGDKIFISLTYSPKSTTLKKKFGNLPVRYMRTRLDDENDFKILEKVVRKYKFNLLDDQIESVAQQNMLESAIPSTSEGVKRKHFYLEPPPNLWDEDSNEMLETILETSKRAKNNSTTATDALGEDDEHVE